MDIYNIIWHLQAHPETLPESKRTQIFTVRYTKVAKRKAKLNSGADMSSTADILVVEDNAVQRSLMISRLMNKGFTAIGAEGGEEALKTIAEQKVDLVLLDLHMPGLSGHEVLEKIRETHSSIQLPVIIVTAEEETDSIVKSFELGANDYIVKSLSFKISLQRINIQLKLQELSRQSDHAHQMEAMNAMIVTYNHEINNPLAIAYGNLGSNYSKFNEEKFDRTVQALERIKNLVVKIQELDLENIEYSEYTKSTKMLKIS